MSVVSGAVQNPEGRGRLCLRRFGPGGKGGWPGFSCPSSALRLFSVSVCCGLQTELHTGW